MPKIVIAGNFSKIEEEPDIEFLAKLDKHLSFFVEGAQHSPMYRGYVNSEGKFVKWDGFKKLMTRNLGFASGLVERVQKFYSDHEREILIEDRRPPKSIGKPISIEENLAKLGITPYDYQVETANVVDKYDRGIIRLPTGVGKSNLAAMMTAKLGKSTIIFVIGKDLLYQFHKLFSKVFNEEIGIIGDGLCSIKNINIASVWTVGQAVGLKKKEIILDDIDGEKDVSKDKYSEILRMLRDAKVHIYDECHYCAAETFSKIYKSSNAEYTYGLSGTPWRSGDGGEDLLLEAILGNYIANIPAAFFIENGYLAKPIIKFISVPYEKVPRNYAQAYKEYIVENPIRNALVLKYTKLLVNKGYKTLVLFNSIKHGKILYDLISPEIECEVLDGSDDQERRDFVKDRLNKGEINCILASRIFQTGIDLPILSGLVLSGGGKSSSSCLQRIGRVIRKYPGKTTAAIVDFADNAVYLKQHAQMRYKVYCSEAGFEVGDYPLK